MSSIGDQIPDEKVILEGEEIIANLDQNTESEPDKPLEFIELPEYAIEMVMDFLSYDEVAQNRMVCRRMNTICSQILNRAFTKTTVRHAALFKHIKSLLPRRESERRNHPLARHADILTCIETRLSMLTMTYSKYIDLNMCCFIPGKVLDEISKVLKLVSTPKEGLRAHEILQELRDISSMAIEHFDEHVVNLLKRRYTAKPLQCMISSASTSKSLMPPPLCIFDFQNKQKSNSRFVFGLTTPSESKNIEPHIREIRTETREALSNRCLDAEVNKKLIVDLKVKNKILGDKVKKMEKIQARQTRQLRLSALLFSKMNTQLMEMKRRLNEVESKNTDIAANFSHITGIKPKASNNVELLQQVLDAALPEHRAPVIQPRSSSIYKKRTAEEILGVNADILKKRTRSE